MNKGHKAPKEYKEISQKLKLSKEQKEFYVTENEAIIKEWNAYHLHNRQLKETKDDIATAIIQFGLALKSLNKKLKQLEEETKEQPSDMRTRFMKKFRKDIYKFDLF